MAVPVALPAVLRVESDIGSNKRESDKGIAREVIKKNDKGEW
jgi:hypothetical protein